MRFIARIFKKGGAERKIMVTMSEYLAYEQSMIPLYQRYHKLLVDSRRIKKEKSWMEEVGTSRKEIGTLRNFLDKRGVEGV